MRPAFVIWIVSPVLIALKKFRTKVAILDEKNIFHVRPKDQNELGRETS